jgi:hypothetical protein
LEGEGENGDHWGVKGKVAIKPIIKARERIICLVLSPSRPFNVIKIIKLVKAACAKRAFGIAEKMNPIMPLMLSFSMRIFASNHLPT